MWLYFPEGILTHSNDCFGLSRLEILQEICFQQFWSTAGKILRYCLLPLLNSCRLETACFWCIRRLCQSIGSLVTVSQYRLLNSLNFLGGAAAWHYAERLRAHRLYGLAVASTKAVAAALLVPTAANEDTFGQPG